MTTILLHTANAITPTAEILDAGILIRDGVIEAVGARQDLTLPAGAIEISATDQTAVPGFVDVHIHGAGGHDVMEGTDEAMSAVANTLSRRGTTSFVATTVTASPDDAVALTVSGVCVCERNSGNDPNVMVWFAFAVTAKLRATGAAAL